MKKILISMAVAAAMVPAMAQADVTVSGVVEVGIGSSDIDDDELKAQWGDVEVNFGATTDLGFGTGYGNMRLDAEGPNVVEGDAIKVGVKGDFGDVSLGDVGSAVGKGLLGGDLLDEATGCSACLAYTNSFDGLGLKVAADPAGNYQTLADDGSVANKGKDWGVSVGVDYSISGVALGAGTYQRGDDSWTAVGAGYNLNGIALGVSYEMIEGTGATDLTGEDEASNIGASAYYTTGAWTFGGKMYKLAGKDEDVATKLRVEATNALSDSMSINFRINNTMDDSPAEGDDVMDYRVQLSKTF